MKKHIQSSQLFRPAFLLAALSATSSFAPLNAHATGDETTPEVSIIQVTSLEGRPTFQVRVDKPGTEAFDLSIADAEGEVLFSETIRGAHYDRYFQVDIPMDNVKLLLQLEARKGRQKQTYEIRTQTRHAAGVTVARP